MVILASAIHVASLASGRTFCSENANAAPLDYRFDYFLLFPIRVTALVDDAFLNN